MEISLEKGHVPISVPIYLSSLLSGKLHVETVELPHPILARVFISDLFISFYMLLGIASYSRSHLLLETENSISCDILLDICSYFRSYLIQFPIPSCYSW
jgi:hypothetical protein